MTGTEHPVRAPWIQTLTSIVLVVAALYLAKGVLVPVALAALLSFLLVPVCDRLERARIDRIPSVLVTVIIAFMSLGAGTWVAAGQMMELAPKLPEYQANFRTKLDAVNDYLSATLGRLRGSAQVVRDNLPQAGPIEHVQVSVQPPALVRVVPAEQSPLELIGSIFGPMLVVMGSAGILAVLVIFFLLRREDLRDRFIRLVYCLIDS